MLFWTAFTLGLLGSTHCVGMCGPIALALPLDGRERLWVVMQALLYNLGRISTYITMGLVFGLLGEGLFLAGWQKGFSIVVGSALLLFALFSIDFERKVAAISFIRYFHQFVQRKIAGYFRRNTLGATYLVGFLNGFLPCGMVYLALAGAVASGGLLSGSLFMALFGLGTLPLMLGITLAGKRIPATVKKSLRKMAPFVMAAFAIFLIARGIEVELPAELKFWEALRNPVMCH